MGTQKQLSAVDRRCGIEEAIIARKFVLRDDFQFVGGFNDIQTAGTRLRIDLSVDCNRRSVNGSIPACDPRCTSAMHKFTGFRVRTKVHSFVVYPIQASSDNNQDPVAPESYSAEGMP